MDDGSPRRVLAVYCNTQNGGGIPKAEWEAVLHPGTRVLREDWEPNPDIADENRQGAYPDGMQLRPAAIRAARYVHSLSSEGGGDPDTCVGFPLPTQGVRILSPNVPGGRTS